ncbi:MAG: DUF1697 domain-containing protein [Candidatus Nanopelagicales bacterium]|nr:DUF1697 domain-containing protein [Candidatus Nanopelagicales bacterium]
MTTVIVLLRGINVGGNNRIRMAELRAALAAHGFVDVRTYIQSGNVVAEHRSRSTAVVARQVESIIEASFSLQVPAIVRTRAQLLGVVRNNPYPHEADPKRLHAIFLPEPHSQEAIAGIAQLQESLWAKGSNDSVGFAGDVLYLHTPDGFGTSDLAKALTTRSGRLIEGGTARNWATVLALVDLSA